MADYFTKEELLSSYKAVPLQFKAALEYRCDSTKQQAVKLIQEACDKMVADYQDELKLFATKTAAEQPEHEHLVNPLLRMSESWFTLQLTSKKSTDSTVCHLYFLNTHVDQTIFPNNLLKEQSNDQ